MFKLRFTINTTYSWVFVSTLAGMVFTISCRVIINIPPNRYYFVWYMYCL